MCCVLAILILAITSGNAVANATDETMHLEVFTTTDLEIVDKYAVTTEELYWDINLQLYQLDGIQLIEAELSKDLPVNPGQSKHLALQRLQLLDDQKRARMQRSAIGLAMAIQYGIDRLPAIVFDGHAIVYGVSDLHGALAHYQKWRTGKSP